MIYVQSHSHGSGLHGNHGQAKNIPEEIDFDTLLDIAIICDYYDCAAVMNPGSRHG